MKIHKVTKKVWTKMFNDADAPIASCGMIANTITYAWRMVSCKRCLKYEKRTKVLKETTDKDI